jgi:hypothetical protein
MLKGRNRICTENVCAADKGAFFSGLVRRIAEGGFRGVRSLTFPVNCELFAFPFKQDVIFVYL